MPSSVVNRRVDRAPLAFQECSLQIADVVALHRHFMSSALVPAGTLAGRSQRLRIAALPAPERVGGVVMT